MNQNQGNLEVIVRWGNIDHRPNKNVVHTKNGSG